MTVINKKKTKNQHEWNKIEQRNTKRNTRKNSWLPRKEYDLKTSGNNSFIEFMKEEIKKSLKKVNENIDEKTLEKSIEINLRSISSIEF